MTATMTQELTKVHQAELHAEAAQNRLAASTKATPTPAGASAGTRRLVALFAGLVASLVH